MLKHRWVGITLAVIAELVLVLVVFRAGEAIGYRRANFGLQWGENYSRFFGQPRMGFFEGFPNEAPDADDFNAHGSAGTVLSVATSTNTIVIKTVDNTEQTIAVAPNASIRSFMQNISLSDVKVGDSVVVIGAPNNSGQIVAQFIRVFPAGTPVGTTSFRPRMGMMLQNYQVNNNINR